ncbi:Glycopeptide antibiotics resistance protein [Microbacterium sp. cf046]|nr:Glycopeptide antibiotics resistance protein [Microbacterium sp. cf046]
MSAPANVLTGVLFAVYLVLLTWLVVWKLHVPYIGDASVREIKLIPFVRTAGAGSNAPFEVIANVAVFIPFGVYLGLVVPSWRWWKAIFLIAGTSLAMELAQYVLAVGKTDVTDVIANTAGGLAGLGLISVARAALRSRTALVMSLVLGVGTALVVLACAVFATAPPLQSPPGSPQGVRIQLRAP